MAVDLLCVGGASLDIVVAADHAPRPDERVEAREIVQAGGGPAATAAVAAARLGVSVGFCGRMGRDAHGDAVMESLEAEGVDVSLVERDRDIATGTSVIAVDLSNAHRMIFARSAPPPSHVPDAGQWVHVDQVGYQCLTAADRSRAKVSIDHGNPIHGLRLDQIALYAPTRPMLETVRNAALLDAARACAEDGASTVVVTDGAQGSWILDSGDLRLVPSFQLDGPLSTLGAGDVFHGALLAGVVTELPLAEAVRRANACAALSCLGLDGRSAIPTAAELDDFLLSQLSTTSAPNPTHTERQS